MSLGLREVSILRGLGYISIQQVMRGRVRVGMHTTSDEV